MVTTVAMDISYGRPCKFHMKGLKLINSFELRANKLGWTAKASNCLFRAWMGGLGVQVCVGRMRRVGVCVCPCFVCAQAGGRVTKRPDVCISKRAKIYLPVSPIRQQDT